MASPAKRVVVAGATGFVGRAVASHLASAGWDVVVLTRKPGWLSPRHGVLWVQWDARGLGPWVEFLTEAEAVINLAGEPILGVWTPSKRRAIVDSRVRATEALGEAMAAAGSQARLLQGSAMGIYGDRGEEEVDEGSPVGAGFLAQVAQEWERAARAVERRVVLRLALVVGPGGFLRAVEPVFRWGLGARVGGGEGWVSWISLEDAVRVFDFVLLHEELQGVVNVCAPCPVRQRDLVAALARRYRRPAPWRIPRTLVRLVGGLPREMLASQRGVPRVLRSMGFSFVHPTLDAALSASP